MWDGVKINIKTCSARFTSGAISLLLEVSKNFCVNLVNYNTRQMLQQPTSAFYMLKAPCRSAFTLVGPPTPNIIKNLLRYLADTSTILHTVK